MCRVRMEAAIALGQVAGRSPDATGVDHLLRFCQGRLFDSSLGMPAAWQFADLAEHYVNQVCIWRSSLCLALLCKLPYALLVPSGISNSSWGRAEVPDGIILRQ